jgi:dihydrodiol dehydrogenase / D-xylose 1-dehydrogenase (NADP)
MMRWGILGTSYICTVVADSIIASPESEIHAVFGRDQTRLKAFADRYTIPVSYSTSINDLLDDPAVDVVYVDLPTHKHAEAAIAAAARGKAILSEKSLATTMKDAHAMIAAVKDKNIFFLEGLMYLSHPFMKRVVDIIKEGELGAVRGVSGYYAAGIARNANPHGMGTIYNLGCYPVSLLHLIMETAYGSGAFKARTVLGHGNLSHDGGVPHVRDAALTTKFDVGLYQGTRRRKRRRCISIKVGLQP